MYGITKTLFALLWIAAKTQNINGLEGLKLYSNCKIYSGKERFYPIQLYTNNHPLPVHNLQAVCTTDVHASEGLKGPPKILQKRFSIYLQKSNWGSTATH